MVGVEIVYACDDKTDFFLLSILIYGSLEIDKKGKNSHTHVIRTYQSHLHLHNQLRSKKKIIFQFVRIKCNRSDEFPDAITSHGEINIAFCRVEKQTANIHILNVAQ